MEVRLQATSSNGLILYHNMEDGIIWLESGNQVPTEEVKYNYLYNIL